MSKKKASSASRKMPADGTIEVIPMHEVKRMKKKDLIELVGGLQRQIADLRKHIAELERAERTADLESPDDKDKEMERLAEKLENEKAKNKTDHTNSHKPSSAKEFPGKIPNNRVKTGKKPGAQPGHKHQPRKLRTQVDEVTVLAMPDAVLQNPLAFELTGQTIRKQQLELVIKEYVHEWDAPVYRNIRNGQLVWATFPDEVGKDEVNYGPVYKAVMMYLTGECNVPARKACKFVYEVSGGTAQISHGNVAQLTKKFSKLTERERKEIAAEAHESAMAHIDTTAARMNSKRVAVNVMVTDTVAYFLATMHKGVEAWDQMPTMDYKNLLISDGETTFLRYGTLHQLCVVHLMRELRGLSEREPFREWYSKMRDLLGRIIHERKNNLDQDSVGSVEKWAEQIRKEYDEICSVGLQAFEGKKLNKAGKKGLALLNRFINRKNDILFFIDHPEVPYDNNIAERMLRSIKRKTKAGVTWRSLDYLGYYADFLTVTRTGKMRGDEVFETLVRVFGGAA